MLLGDNPVGGPAPISVLGGLKLILRALGGPVGEAPALPTAAAAATAATASSAATAAAAPAASVHLRDAAELGAFDLLVIRDLLKFSN